MKLCEHRDFDQAILQASDHFRSLGLRPALIEKDYYVTEVLRIVAVGDKVIFKGGTSLSKGWNLIQRFSEDIDLFLDPLAFEPVLKKRAIDRELKRLRDSIGQHPALTYVQEVSRAAPETAMTHIAIQENLDGKTVDWLEKVSDARYAPR